MTAKLRPRVIVRALRLTSVRRRLLARALVTVALASAAVSMLSFKHSLSFGRVPLGDGPGPSIEDAVWAVEAAAARLPLRTMCIEKGLAVQRLLRRGGIAAQLHFGARLDPDDRALKAHVWVSVDGNVVIGGEVAAGFAEIPLNLGG